MAQRISLEEQEKILMHAMGLLREPESFTVGKWKCPIYETGTNGKRTQKVDDNGRPQFSYCVEGAVNQATHDILGLERAVALGAGKRAGKDLDGFDPTSTRLDGPVELMRLNDEAWKMYGKEMGWLGQRGQHHRAALEFNDGRKNYEGIVNVLKGRLSAVRSGLRRKEKKAEA